MVRRRLVVRDSEFQAVERTGAVSSAPIAHLAGDAAAEQGREIARLREAAADGSRLRAAEDQGRLLIDVPLDQIDTTFLTRDRILSADEKDEDEAALALRASLRKHGQRMPVEIVAFAPQDGRALPYGLISGWRRLRALKALHKETGEARFATVRAIVRREAGLAPAFVAMVEENEIRAGLSFYERGRIAALAARQGAFETADDAVDALFAAASPARRSKIRSFLGLYKALDDVLIWPETIGERLGLKLAQAVKWGQGDRLREQLQAGAAAHQRPLDEQKLIQALVSGGGQGPKNPSKGAKRGPDPARAQVAELQSGARIERRSFTGHTDIRLSGTSLDEASIEAAFEAVKRALEQLGPDNTSCSDGKSQENS